MIDLRLAQMCGPILFLLKGKYDEEVGQTIDLWSVFTFNGVFSGDLELFVDFWVGSLQILEKDLCSILKSLQKGCHTVLNSLKFTQVVSDGWN